MSQLTSRGLDNTSSAFVSDQCAGKRTFATPKPNPNPPKPSFFKKKTRSEVPKTQKTGCAYSEHYTK